MINEANFSTLTHTGLLRFSSTDAQTFLQGQLSCDVAALSPAQATYGSYSTPKGRMLASFLLWRIGVDYFMQLPRVLCEPIRKRLAMYVMRSKVQVADVSNDYALIGVVGAQAATAMRAALGQISLTPRALTEIDGSWVLCMETTRFAIIAFARQAARLTSALVPHATAADIAVWDLATIHAGIPVITPATQEQFVPQMANLDLIGGVSFSKGCYPGQEIVARMHYLGRLKQRMVLAHVDGAPPPHAGDKLFSEVLGEQSGGMVVNAARVPGGGHDLLAVIQTSTFNANALHLGSLAGPALQMLPLPYPFEAKDPPKTTPA